MGEIVLKGSKQFMGRGLAVSSQQSIVPAAGEINASDLGGILL